MDDMMKDALSQNARRHRDLMAVLNLHSAESASNTPDDILAGFLLDVLDAYDRALVRRGEWRGLP